MDVLEIYDSYSSLGIESRPITYGEEFDMVRNFIDFRKEIFKGTSQKHMAIFIETKINGAYPDVIFAEYDPRCYEFWNNKRSSLSTNELKLLHYIYMKRNVTSHRMIEELFIDYKNLLPSLEALIDAGLIQRQNGYWNIIEKKTVFGVKRIEAVEAKIGKWDQVMQQAIINRTFASESFVLSKRKRAPTSSTVEKISSFGIGIYLYNDTEFSTYSSATRNRFPTNYNSIYLSECIGRILNN